ncbi:hypothetical protein JCM6882_008277 [Rhodosporidiobolus microsporus]
MHARIARTSRIAARTAQAAFAARGAVAAPSLAAPASLIASHSRLFRTSPFPQNGHIPLPSEPQTATPSDAPKEDPTAHAVGAQEGHIPTEEAAASSPSSSSAAKPSSSPAPIDNAAATTLPTEEIPAVSSSLDATAKSTEPSSSPAPIDNEASTSLPTEEIPAVSSSLDATAEAPQPVDPAVEQERVARTVFAGSLSWNVDSDWLKDEVHSLLDATEGVQSIRIVRDHMGRSKGFAFIELSNSDLAKKLIGLTPIIDGRQAEFSASKASVSPPERKPRGVPGAQGARNPPTNTVWLGNVAWSADEVLLEKIFSRYGEIRRIGQPKDFETGRSRGIAYIEFETVDAAAEAVKVGTERGFRVDGRPVRIDFAAKEKRGTNKGRNTRMGSASGGRRRQQ